MKSNKKSRSHETYEFIFPSLQIVKIGMISFISKENPFLSDSLSQKHYVFSIYRCNPYRYNPFNLSYEEATTLLCTCSLYLRNKEVFISNLKFVKEELRGSVSLKEIKTLCDDLIKEIRKDSIKELVL